MQLIIPIKFKLFRRTFAQALSILATFFLVGCGGGFDDLESLSSASQVHPTYAKKAYNKPYQIKGIWYTPQPHYHLNEEGIASYYGGTDVFHGRKTSNGEIFDMNEVSAAHKTLPIPCVLQVTNLENGRSIKVKVNDRGPFIEGRIIDVSRRTAQLLGFYKQGTARVHIKTLMPETMLLVQGNTNEIDSEVTQQTLLAQNTPQSRPQTKSIKAKPIAPQNHETILLALKDEIAEFSQEVEPRAAKSIPAQASLQKVAYVRPATNQISSGMLKTTSLKQPKNYRKEAGQKNPAPNFNKGVFVQAGTFMHPQQAQQAKKLIQRAVSSMPVRLESIKFSQKQLYRVVVGPCRTDRQAKELVNHIRTINCSMPKSSIVVFNG